MSACSSGTARDGLDVPHAVSCRALGVSASWFYKWRARPPAARQQRQARLDAEVRRSYVESDGGYGSPRVVEDLREWGWRVSTKTVAASMARQGLVGPPTHRRFRALTRPDKAARPIPDLVKRDFTAAAINLKWCGDLTEIPTDEGKLYVAYVEDLASRRIPGFAMSEHHDAPLAVAALQMAAAVRGGDVKRCDLPLRSRQRGVQRGTVRGGLSASRRHPVDGRVMLRRRVGELSLHPRVRTAPQTSLHQPSPGPRSGCRLHRSLQPHPSSQLL
jgi:Integrase core domain/HTH-like domain